MRTGTIIILFFLISFYGCVPKNTSDNDIIDVNTYETIHVDTIYYFPDDTMAGKEYVPKNLKDSME